MFFIVHCLDHADALTLRLATHPAHRAYLAQAAMRILVAGPLLAEDGVTMVGSCFLLEAASRAEVEAFNRADPFHTAGVWRQVSIHAFDKRTDNR